MWKHALIGTWCAVLCLSAVYLGATYSPRERSVEPQFPILSEHHIISLEPMTVPIVREGQLKGYVVAEVSLTANDEAWHGRKFPTIEMSDQLMTTLQTLPVMADPNFDLKEVRAGIVAKMNERFGAEAFFQAVLARLEFLSVADIEKTRNPEIYRVKSTSIAKQPA